MVSSAPPARAQLANDLLKSATTAIDCGGACLAPGLIDMRVQTADPGTEHLEDLPTLLRAAASGGITSVVVTFQTQSR